MYGYSTVQYVRPTNSIQLLKLKTRRWAPVFWKLETINFEILFVVRLTRDNMVQRVSRLWWISEHRVNIPREIKVGKSRRIYLEPRPIKGDKLRCHVVELSGCCQYFRCTMLRIFVTSWLWRIREHLVALSFAAKSKKLSRAHYCNLVVYLKIN